MTNGIIKTKVACTIGPQSSVEKLVFGGMNIARLNLAHCSHEFVEETIQILRNIPDVPQVAIWIDVNGPKVRFFLFKLELENFKMDLLL